MKKLLGLFFILTLCCGVGFAQPRQISGTVTGESDGAPIAGVAIVVEGTSTGTVTSADGRFALTANPNATLTLSALGFATQQVDLGGRTNVAIVMAADATALEEVVVVGFGSQKRVNLTGSVASVSAETLQNRPITNISQALQGVVPNLNVSISDGNPKTFASYNVRGATSITPSSGEVSSGSPLILVDGIEMTYYQFSTVNPNDVESLSVIKDASASAIYGARAAYGVMLITTKKGRSGKATINYSYDAQWNSPASQPNMMDAYTATAAEYTLANRSTGAAFTDEQNAQLEAIKKFQDDPRPENAWHDWGGKPAWNGDYNPWDLLVKRSALTQKHTLSASGGTETARYYTSLGYQRQEGLLKGREDLMNRYNGMLNLDVTMNKRLSVAFKVSMNATNYYEPSQPSYQGSIWNQMGDYQRKFHVNMPSLTSATDPTPNSPTNSVVSNYLYSGRVQTTKRSVTTFAVSPEYKIIPSLKLKADLSYRPDTYETKDVQPQFDRVFDGWTPSAVDGTGNGGYITSLKETVGLYTANVYADFNKQFASKHTVSAIAGYNQELWQKHQLYARNTGILSTSLPTLGLTSGDNKTITETDEHWAVRGVFGRINYNFDDKYLVELNGRYDGSSKFPKANRFKFFPSYSAAWRISQESFMEGTKGWLNNLKIRGSYGSIGNQDIANYAFYPTMSTGQASYLINGERPTQVPNPPGLVSPDFTWETATTINGGLDFTMLRSRLDVSFDIYQRTTTDIIIGGGTYPAVLGAAAPLQNAGELRTRGWEFVASWKDRFANGFSYGVKVTLGDNRSKVLSYDANTPKSLTTNSSTLKMAIYSGMNVGEIWGYTTDHIIQKEDLDGTKLINFMDESGANTHRPNNTNQNYYAGDVMYKDLNGDGAVNYGKNTADDSGDLSVIGNNTPRYQYGVALDAAWKGFDLSVFFQGVGKRDVWIGNDRWRGNIDGNGNWEVYNNSWTPQRTNAKYPFYGSGGTNWLTQTGYLFDGSYLKLKQVVLGYTVPQKFTSKIGLSNVRVSLSGYNLFTLTDIPDVYDVDLLSTGYPQIRSYAIGVQVGF